MEQITNIISFELQGKIPGSSINLYRKGLEIEMSEAFKRYIGVDIDEGKFFSELAKKHLFNENSIDSFIESCKNNYNAVN